MHLPPRFRHLLLGGVLVGLLAAGWFLHDASQGQRVAIPKNTVRVPTSVHPSVPPTMSRVYHAPNSPSFSTLTSGLRPGRGGSIPDARAVKELPVVDVAFYNARGNLLSGWLAINTPEAPVIILTHGTPGNRASMISRAAFLYQHGYSTLLFDFQSYGRSQGEVSTLGMVESEDVEAAITYVHDLPATRLSKIGVLGLSMGATAAVLAASRTHDIAALVAESCPVDATRVAADVPDDESRTADQWLVEETYGVDITQARPIDVVQKLSPSTALFFINGDADTITPLAGMYALYQAAEAPKQYWVVSGAGHAQSFTVSTQEYMTRVSAFFDTYLGILPAPLLHHTLRDGYYIS